MGLASHCRAWEGSPGESRAPGEHVAGASDASCTLGARGMAPSGTGVPGDQEVPFFHTSVNKKINVTGWPQDLVSKIHAYFLVFQIFIVLQT